MKYFLAIILFLVACTTSLPEAMEEPTPVEDIVEDEVVEPPQVTSTTPPSNEPVQLQLTVKNVQVNGLELKYEYEIFNPTVLDLRAEHGYTFIQNGIQTEESIVSKEIPKKSRRNFADTLYINRPTAALGEGYNGVIIHFNNQEEAYYFNERGTAISLEDAGSLNDLNINLEYSHDSSGKSVFDLSFENLGDKTVIPIISQEIAQGEDGTALGEYTPTKFYIAPKEVVVHQIVWPERGSLSLSYVFTTENGGSKTVSSQG